MRPRTSTLHFHFVLFCQKSREQNLKALPKLNQIKGESYKLSIIENFAAIVVLVAMLPCSDQSYKGSNDLKLRLQSSIKGQFQSHYDSRVENYDCKVFYKIGQYDIDVVNCDCRGFLRFAFEACNFFDNDLNWFFKAPLPS